ncbi:MAG: acyl-ACP--UDP-N-acetylglucosamine O-acyltransferase [Pseudomonadota bacterium]
MADIHPSAVVSPDCELGENCRIGPFCVVGADVSLGQDVILHSHVVVEGRTRIGDRCEVFPFASIGHRPQDLKYKGEPSTIDIGADNVIREYVTINPGTEGGAMTTRVGSGCLLMVGAHVAHDCAIGDGVILANNVTLAGHVTVEDRVIIGGLSAVRQFVRIGHNAMIGGMSGVEHDVIPFGLVMGERAWLHGLNLVGMKRAGMSRETMQRLNSAFDSLFGEEGTFAERRKKVAEQFGDEDTVAQILKFIEAQISRGVLQPK